MRDTVKVLVSKRKDLARSQITKFAGEDPAKLHEITMAGGQTDGETMRICVCNRWEGQFPPEEAKRLVR